MRHVRFEHDGQVREGVPDGVLTGRPHGVGMFRDPPVLLAPGDEIEVEVGGPGVLSNPVGDHVDAEGADLHYATTEE